MPFFIHRLMHACYRWSVCYLFVFGHDVNSGNNCYISARTYQIVWLFILVYLVFSFPLFSVRISIDIQMLLLDLGV